MFFEVLYKAQRATTKKLVRRVPPTSSTSIGGLIVFLYGLGEKTGEKERLSRPHATQRHLTETQRYACGIITRSTLLLSTKQPRSLSEKQTIISWHSSGLCASSLTLDGLPQEEAHPQPNPDANNAHRC